MIRVICVICGCLWISPVFAQLKVVETELPLTKDQAAVLPLLEQVQQAILQNNTRRLLEMFATDKDSTLQQAAELRVFRGGLADSSSIFSCVVFDTSCVRSILKEEGERRIRLNQPRLAPLFRQASQVFVSVKEFLAQHKGEMQVTFQDAGPGVIQAELHIPRRPDSSTVPPPFATYESLSLNFALSDDGWKITLLFPEAYAIIIPLI